MSELAFYHDKEESEPISLTEQELYDRDADAEDIMNQRDYRDKKKDLWRWSGSVYNIVQNATPTDEISNITLGWIRSYIDTGISQTTNASPEFDYEAFGPTDHTKEVLWKRIVEVMLSQSYYLAHQKVAITDAHIFGPGVLEVYQGTQYRTLRVPNQDGTYTEKVVPDYRKPRCGVRAVSPFRVTRNPDVTDPAEVGSCSKEEVLSWNGFVVKYGRCLDKDGNNKFKNTEMVPKGSHVKVTKYQDENRDVYRIYALSYGNESDGEAETPPEDELGIPIFDRPLKIHDVKNKRGEILRSLGLNVPGMCNLIYLPYIDKLDDNYETHNIYGAGLPEHMEGLDTFMQTAFNMTIDNFRMGNTVVVGVESRDGTVPDFDANTYYGGEFVNANVTSTTLGQDRTANFSQMYETVQGLAIPGTGINVQQITGDTSSTAFEFAQRIKANSERAETTLKGWESGPLKRLGTLALSAALTELTTYDLEQIAEDKADDIFKNIKEGRETRDDYEFENGKPVGRRNRFYISMEGYREDFAKRKTRSYSVDEDTNTLVNDDSGKVNRIPLAKEYVYPSWSIESGVPYDVTVDSRRMITNKRIQDVQTIQVILQSAIQGMQIDEEFRNRMDFGKFFEQILQRSDFDIDAFSKETKDEKIAKIRKTLKSYDEQLTPQAPEEGAAIQPSLPLEQTQQNVPQPPQALMRTAEGNL